MICLLKAVMVPGTSSAMLPAPAMLTMCVKINGETAQLVEQSNDEQQEPLNFLVATTELQRRKSTTKTRTFFVDGPGPQMGCRKGEGIIAVAAL